MEQPDNLRAAWLKAGWKRGAFIRLDSNPDLLGELPKKIVDAIADKNLACIVPIIYDCALVEQSFYKEPWAQVLVVWQAKFDGNFANARNPRKLHITALEKSNSVCFEVSALSFAQVDRETLLKAVPDQSIQFEDDNLSMLLDWVAQRYRQATFPDSFNKRLDPFRKSLKKLWESELFGKFASGVFVKIDTNEELHDDDIYNIEVIISIPYFMRGREYRNFEQNHSHTMITQLKSIFDTAKGIELKKIETLTERELTKEVERQFSRFSLEYFSYNSGLDEHPLPGEFLGA